MTVQSPVRVSGFTTQVDENLHKISCAIAGGDPSCIAKAAFSEPAVRQQMLDRVIQEIEGECAKLCRRQPVSPFRKIQSSQMESLSWDFFNRELQLNCPVLHRILQTVVAHSDGRNSKKKGDAHFPGICMAAAILLKERNREMVGVQSFVSLVLFNSRVKKNVSLTVVI